MKLAVLVAAAVLAAAPPVFAQSHPDEAAGSEAPEDPHAGHEASGESEAAPPGDEPPPAPPRDHAADRLFDRKAMEAAREQLRHEHGDSRVAKLVLNTAEYQVRSEHDGYRWEGEGWLGGDIDRLVAKSEGQGTVDEGVGDAEVQLLYSRAITPYFDLQGGIRYDFEPNPSRTYGTIGFEGLAPYWFQVEGALFVSERADVLARIEGYYDQPITQRLIARPRVELDFAAQDVEENEIGSGLSSFELELRLRYEIRRELAPYLGVSWQRKTGDTADFARGAGERASSTSLVLGILAWF